MTCCGSFQRKALPPPPAKKKSRRLAEKQHASSSIVEYEGHCLSLVLPLHSTSRAVPLPCGPIDRYYTKAVMLPARGGGPGHTVDPAWEGRHEPNLVDFYNPSSRKLQTLLAGAAGSAEGTPELQAALNMRVAPKAAEAAHTGAGLLVGRWPPKPLESGGVHPCLALLCSSSPFSPRSSPVLFSLLFLLFVFFSFF